VLKKVQKYTKNSSLGRASTALLKSRKKNISWGKVDWENAPDVKKRLILLSKKIEANWLKIDAITCFRSTKSKARAYARVWGLSRVWQLALVVKPHYIIEVLAQNYDRLPQDKQDEVLLHEIAHIPKNFSGSLLPHVKKGKRKFKDRVRELVNSLRKEG